MQNMYPGSSVVFTRASSSSWQSQVRRSVRLYLAFGDQSVDAQELETHLQRTEEELLQYLLAGEPPTPDARKQAQTVLDMAQNALLGSEAEVQALLREFSAEQAIEAWPAPTPPTTTGEPLP